MRKKQQSPYLDGVQGDKGMSFGQTGKASLTKRQLTRSAEQRSKPYIKYGARVAEAATPQSAKSTGGAVWRLYG